MRRGLFPVAGLLVLGGWLGVRPATAAPESSDTTGVVRVRVTAQAHDFTRPWLKRPPLTREAVGAVLSGNRVVTTAELVALYEELAQGARRPGSDTHLPPRHQVTKR